MRLGNLTIKDIEDRCNITLTYEEKEYLKNTKCESANNIPKGNWHCFDIPFQIICGDEETAKKMFKGEPETFKQKFDRELEEMDKPDSDARKRAEHIANSIMGLL